MKPNELYEMFKGYTYEYRRPNVIPNNSKTCDCSLFVAWYTAMTYSIPSLMHGDITSWNLYANLVYSKRLFWQGSVSRFDLNYLRNGDIVILSNRNTFNTEYYDDYWCGIYWDKNTFLNFNSVENFGYQPLKSYLKGMMNYSYIAVLRPRNVVSYRTVANNSELHGFKKP